jgi:alpha-beta hydrolase superfamily lysophospholipase
MAKELYYLTGMGGRLDAGLGLALQQLGFVVRGRELVGSFRQLNFQQKIDLITKDLQGLLDDPDALVVANSFGAYLLLHTLASLPPFAGAVVLLSPIVGEFGHDEKRLNFIPPRDGLLQKWAASGSYPVPKRCELHVGDQDWQSNPEAVTDMGRLMGIPVSVVPDAGHKLPPDYVSRLMQRWLA